MRPLDSLAGRRVAIVTNGGSGALASVGVARAFEERGIFYPPELVGEDETGWHDRSMSILYAASQVRAAQQAALARENLARLREACEVALMDPVPYAKVRGARFYRQFLDNAEWPSFMRDGRVSGLTALSALDRRIRG